MGEKIILIAGGSGFLGKEIGNLLRKKEFIVRILTRSVQKKLIFDQYIWNPSTGYIDPVAFDNVDVVINLSGASLANKRWSTSYKHELRTSRILSTQLLVEKMNSLACKPGLFISASGTGIYGHQPDQIITEESLTPKEGFIPTLCIDWEDAAKNISNEIRNIVIRTGIVLSMEEGYIAKTRIPSLFGIAPLFGDGSQMQSWIHINDLCKAILFMIENSNLRGIVNLTSPYPCSQAKISNLMARKSAGFSIPIPIPVWIMKILVGQLAPTLVESQFVLPKKLSDGGFKFDYGEIDTALNELIRKRKSI